MYSPKLWGFLFKLYFCSSTQRVAVSKNNVGQKSHFPSQVHKGLRLKQDKVELPMNTMKIYGIFIKSLLNPVKKAAFD